VLSYPVFRILCISYAPLLVMIFYHTLIVSHTLFKIYLAEFEGQTCSHLCFLHCFPYIIFTHMGAHFCINIVATAHLFGILRTRIPTNLLYYYSSSLSVSLQHPTHLPSIIHIE